MRRSLVLGTLVAAGLLSAAVGAAQRGGRGAAPPMEVGVERLADNLYVLTGGGGNTAAFVTADGVVLVDTKLPGWGQPLIDKVAELTDRPITTIINTHTHFDHASGNVEFPASVQIVTQENTARLMREANPVLGIQTGPQPNIYEENGGRGYATRTFTDRLTLGTGNDRVELYHFGRAHTSGDAFVVFPGPRVMHTGDAFPNKGIPIMDANNGGSGLAYPETLARAGQLPGIDTVIIGHGPQMTMADVREYAEFNRALVDAVRAAKQAGRSVDEIASTWKVPARFTGYAQPPADRLRTNVQVIWDELN
jgi:glyoxylase-like metal-dependent hydrolase (beta-lactamase superfamily II)